MKRFYPCLLLVLLAALLTQSVYASGGIATDDLRIRVGYFGMDTDEYVDVNTYHWSELEGNLPLHYQAYTFLRSGEDGAYRVVVDSAMGFYIDDLLAYANIGISDVQSMNFYTRDQETGYFTSFSLAELLESRRYYFEDLPAHLYPIYGEDGSIQGYDDSEAWQYAVEVRPMLALEDSWVTYEVGTEHVSEDFNAMGTANRFRLLFGQTSPMESRTNQTAKYVYAINVTLDGQPEVVEKMKPLEGTIGSHKTTMTISVGNLDILKNLQQLLKFQSSDGTVLRIDGWTVTPDSTYSDLATVEITYTVLQEGTASITGNMGGMTLQTEATVEVPPAEEKPTEEKPSDEKPTEEKPADGKPSDTKPAEDKPSDVKPAEEDPSGEKPAGEKPGEEQPPEEVPGEEQPAEDLKQDEEDQQPAAPQESGAETSGNAPAPEQPESDGGETGQMIRLSAELSALLEQLGSNQGQQGDTPQNQADSAPAVQPEDNRRILLYTGLGALALCLCGAAAETLYFRKERIS